MQITAKDIDSGENARITYSLMDMPVLSIEAETGILHIESEVIKLIKDQIMTDKSNAKETGLFFYGSETRF